MEQITKKCSRKIRKTKTFIIWLIKLVNMLMVDWGSYILRLFQLNDWNIPRRHFDICFSAFQISINWAINLIGLC